MSGCNECKAEALSDYTECLYPECTGWTIEKNPKPIPYRDHDYDFWHKDYDGADGGNHLAGTASSEAHAIEQIIEIEKERDEVRADNKRDRMRDEGF